MLGTQDINMIGYSCLALNISIDQAISKLFCCNFHSLYTGVTYESAETSGE